ncbi:MAG: DNA-packaging protein [Burkholderiales bacterium]|nr:DNA-packaging protein [Burkholderiales bacterium]
MTMTPSLLRERSAWRRLPLTEQARQLRTDTAAHWRWHLWARDEQLPPAGYWTYWLILAGRGFGKTRTGAEWVRQEVRASRYVNLIGATADDARDIMIEGESGILAICPKRERPEYKASQRKLLWPNGATSLIFTADEPERLRGKQHEKLWADELAAWRYPEAWAQAKFGLRLGNQPRACITTTPKPSTLVRTLVADPATHVTRGTTYANRVNLAPAFFDQIIKTYEGTRLGRQELNAELLDDNPHALWNRAQIDALRRPALTPGTRDEFLKTQKRIVVAIDPAVTSNPDSDETGIIVAGRDREDHLNVLADLSRIGTPEQWARAAVGAFHAWGADRLIAETNNGGDMVEAVIRQVDRLVPYRKVTASRGKTIRAEPVAALYEQGRAHHIGPFDRLEDQMCAFDPTESQRAKSPDRMDALVWAATELFGGVSRAGSVSELRL